MQKFRLFFLSILLSFVFLISCTENTRKSSVNSSHNPEARLNKLGINLYDPGTPKAAYVHAVRSGNMLYLSGKGPFGGDSTIVFGKLGKDLTVEQGYAAARLVGIAQLSAMKAELGDLNRVSRIVKVFGMVNATENFREHSSVINGFSELMIDVFGDKGKHARSAVGMQSLPWNISVEIEMIVEIEE